MTLSVDEKLAVKKATEQFLRQHNYFSEFRKYLGFQVVETNMHMVSVNKVQSASLNNKRFYFHDGIVSLPFGHFFLNKVKEQKEKYKTEIQHQIHNKKYDFLKEEAAAVSQCERLRVLGSIFGQPALLYLLDSNILMRTPSINSTTDYILNLNWK